MVILNKVFPFFSLDDKRFAESTNHVPSQTIKCYYRVDRREIAFLRFIFEAYDGIAVMRTLDPAAGIIVLHVSPGCERDAEMILQDLKKDIMIEPADL